MIPVFHIFKKQAQFLKSDYTPEIRKSFSKWEDRINSKSGYLSNDKLFLSSEKKEEISVNSTGVILLQDTIYHTDNIRKESPSLICFNKQLRIIAFEQFSIEKSDTEEFELFLRPDEYDLHTGIPKRSTHKLCVLKKGFPVEITINVMSNFTMTGRKQKTYYEYDFIIEYIGDAQEVEFLAPNKIEIVRDIPKNISKVIDLRKAFY